MHAVTCALVCFILVCTCVSMWNWACIKRDCRLACVNVHVCLCTCVPGVCLDVDTYSL